MNLVNHILSDPEQALFLGALAIGAFLLVGFFVIEYGDDSYKARETLRVNPFGEVLERKKE